MANVLGIHRQNTPRASRLLVLLGACLLVGCQQPFFITEQEYIFFNHITPQADPNVMDSRKGEVIPEQYSRNVNKPQGSVQWNLTLQQAIKIALKNNKEVLVQQYDPGIQGASIEEALATFDPTLTADAFWTKDDIPTFFLDGHPMSIESDTFNCDLDLLTLSKTNATGGTTSISYGLNYAPLDATLLDSRSSWLSSVEVGFSQPLLQGAGVEINRLPVLVARVTHEQSLADFQTVVHQVLFDVENNYWDLYFQYANLNAINQGMKLALRAWQSEKTKLLQRESTIADVAQSREQYESFRFQRLSAVEAVLLSEAQLRESMGLPPNDDRQIVPADDPAMARYIPQWNVAVQSALTQVPALARARLEVRSAEFDLLEAKNNRLPSLDVSGTYTVYGLDNQFDQSIDRLTDNRFGSWTFGLEYSVPVGLRSASAQLRAARLTLSQARADLTRLEFTQVHLLNDAVQRIYSRYEQIEAAERRLLAASEQVKAFVELVNAGDASLINLIFAQATYVTALQLRAQAISSYNQALAGLQLVQGTIAQNDHVRFAEQTILTPDDQRLAQQRAWQERMSVPIPIFQRDATSADPAPVVQPVFENIELTVPPMIQSFKKFCGLPQPILPNAPSSSPDNSSISSQAK